MTRFAYQVRDLHGSSNRGVLTAATQEEAVRQLRSDGSVILELRETAQAATAASTSASAEPSAPIGRLRVNRDDVIFFANQLAVMVDTGVPLAEALDAINEQTQSESLHRVLTDVSDQVRNGLEFSKSLARHPRVFSDLFVAMVRASEATGTLGKMLQRVAGYLEQQRQLYKRVKGAMAYPLAMLGFCILVVVGMLVFILPRFEKIYAGKAAALPTPTKLLLWMSNALVNHWLAILLTLAIGVVGCVLFFRRKEGKILLDQLRISLPVLGPMSRKSALARCLRTLATMVASGVSMLEALEITADVSGNIHFARMWRGLVERLKEGKSLSEEMYGCKLVPRSVTQMVSAGERTGKLGPVLDRVAGFCEEDLDITIRTITSFIEPVMIVVMGTIVGGIAMALLLPIFSMSKVVAGG